MDNNLKELVDIECIKDFLIDFFTAEALQALYDLISSLKMLIMNWANLYLIQNIDKALEDFILKLELEPFRKLSEQLNNYIAQFRSFFPPELLENCSGINEIMSKIDLGLSVFSGIFGFINDFINRYKVSGFIEQSFSSFLQECLNYLDLLLLAIGEAIASKTKEVIK